MRRFGVSDETIASGVATPEFRALLRHEVDYARSLFEQGLPLIGRVNRDLALDLDLFSRGGLEILRAIERCDYDVLSARPAISKRTKLALALRALGGKALPFLRLGPQSTGKTCLTPTAPSHDRSGPRLRSVPRRSPSAKPRISITPSSRFPLNAATPSAPSTPSCARPTTWPTTRTFPREERRRRLNAWLAAWHERCQRRRQPRPRLPRRARRDRALQYPASAARRARRPAWPWIWITRPTARPTPTQPSPISIAIATWSRRSWAWSAFASSATRGERAEKLAEETGIAFQLTNILRDVAEDAARNRVYLPLNDLAATEFRSMRCCIARPTRRPRRAERDLLAAMARRAEDYYRSRDELLPLDRPRKPPRALGSGFHLSRAAEAH